VNGPDAFEIERTPLHPLVELLFARDPGGRSWLPGLLDACEGARAHLGEIVDDPGYLEVPLAVRGQTGMLACFSYPAAPTRQLLRWYIDHPEALTRPATAESSASAETKLLRRTLLDDEPAGTRVRAQDRARDLLRSGTPRLPTWWRFEEAGRLDCLLATPRLVVSVTVPCERGGLRPATPWYPQRSELVRDLESARRLAEGRAFAGVLICDGGPPAEVADGSAVAATVAAGTPHLDKAGRDDVRNGYLGCLSWARLRAATGATDAGDTDAAGAGDTDAAGAGDTDAAGAGDTDAAGAGDTDAAGAGQALPGRESGSR
jgi:hypothetical protein